MVSCWGALIKKQSPGTTTPRSQGTSKNSITESRHSSTSAGSNKSTASVSFDGVYPDGQILETPKLKIYSFAELKAATRNFRADAVLGEGCFGRVFKGWVDEKTYAPSKPGSGMAVAVKRWNPGSFQGLPEWKTEVNLLGKLSHPNLVKLIGSCSEDKELLLVYEFMQRGSLDNHLFRRGSACKPLSWSTRLKIALDAAHGLAFLHTLRKPIIYRDFKTSSILLDGKFNAKLSNSGLAKNAPENGDSYVSTRVMSTSGYGAPEYIASGHLYVKSDVYCFGVVLLEILTGLRVHDANRPYGQHNLVEWAKPSLSHRAKLTRIMDSQLKEQYPLEDAIQAAKLTLKCLGSNTRNRPSMTEVVEALERIQANSKIASEKQGI